MSVDFPSLRYSSAASCEVEVYARDRTFLLFPVSLQSLVRRGCVYARLVYTSAYLCSPVCDGIVSKC